jgi:hypothetical protein
VAHKARTGPSFKAFVAALRADAARRLALERGLLLDAFISRGKVGARREREKGGGGLKARFLTIGRSLVRSAEADMHAPRGRLQRPFFVFK